jgi:prophage antirepressor-like protein
MKPEIFLFDDAPVRVAMRDGEPWFVAADAGRVLGIQNVRMSMADFPSDERDAVSITDGIGREQETTVLSEPGLYRLIFQSRKEGAERFKKWVFAEVLPAIRKTGIYVNGILPGKGEDDVMMVRRILFDALRGLEEGKITVQRASVTAKLAAQYVKTWQLTMEVSGRALPEPEAEGRTVPGTVAEWEQLLICAVQRALADNTWPVSSEEVTGGEVLRFTVGMDQLQAVCREAGVLKDFHTGGAVVWSALSRGLGLRLGGKTVAVPEHGHWTVERWRNAERRGWEFRRVPEGPPTEA